MKPLETIKFKDKVLKVYFDELAESPRKTFDNMAKMVLFHNRYCLGDKNDYKSDDYSGWPEMQKAIEKKENPILIKPMYLLDHSGMAIRTTPFNDKWDSGQIGFVFVTKKQAQKEYNKKKFTPVDMKNIESVLEGEVKDYDKFLRNEVYYYVVEDTEGNHYDSCGGFYDKEYMIKSALANADCTEAEIEELINQLA